MKQPSVSPSAATDRTPWPIIRFVTVVIATTLWARWHLEWKPPAPAEIQAAVVGLFVLFIFFGLLSITLARLYIALVFFPVYATTKLNAWLYDGSYWTFRTVLRLLYMRRVSAVAAWAGELALFIGLWRLLEFLIHRYV